MLPFFVPKFGTSKEERRVVLMNRKWEKFKKSVMYFSAKERKGRLLSCDRNKYLRLQEMPDLELKLTYINLKSEYEHNKMTLVLFFVFVAITVLIGGWGFFESFLKMMEPLSIYYHGSAVDGVWVVFVIAFTVVPSIVFLMIVLGKMYIKQTYCTYKQLLMIEEIRKQ